MSSSKPHSQSYFATAPWQLILTHWPTNPSHQFLPSALSLEDMQAIIPVPMTAFKQGIVPLTWSSNLYTSGELQCPVISVDLKAPKDVIISAFLIPGHEIDLPEERFKQNVYVKRSKGQWIIQVTTPLKGSYKLNIYKKVFHQNSCEDELMCLSYNVHCDADSELKLGYPKRHEAALTTHKLRLLHWNSPTMSYVCQNLSGSLSLVFKCDSNLNFDHYISPGRVSTGSENSMKRYNTLLLSDNKCLFQLQAVFPSNGWWTIHLTGALPSDKDSQARHYTPLLTYHVYVTVGLPRSSYPHITSPCIQCRSIKPITATGDDVLKMQFLSSKSLTPHHYITYDALNNDQLEGFTNIEFDGKLKNENYYVYSISAVFPDPGNWYIHIFSREEGTTLIGLLRINVHVTGARKNTSFITYNHSVGDSYGIRILNNGLVTFLDNGDPLNYKFEALSNTTFSHTLKSCADEDSTNDYSTYVSCDDNESGSPSTTTYTLSAVFPSMGKWLIKLFALKEGSKNYTLILTIPVIVTNPSTQFCYPKIKPAFQQFNMKIDETKALMKSACESEEFKFPFKALEGNHFTWNMELLATGEKLHSNAFIHYSGSNSGPYNRLLHVIFPKPGEWVIRVFSKKADSTDKPSNFQPIIEFRLKSSVYKSGVSFPQLFEPFYSTFNLQLDSKSLPITSTIEQIPAKIVILICGPNNIDFWHDIDIENEDENKEKFMEEDQCKIISDDFAGQHKLIIDINVKGKWTVSLYAKKSTAVGHNWTSIMKCLINA